jgi:hypothetical protein
VSATTERGEAGGSGGGGRVGQDANGFDETVRGQPGEAKHQRRPRAGRWQQRRGPLHGNPPLGGVIADGGGVLRLPTGAEATALVYLGTVISAGAFLLWYDALPRLGADRAGLFAGMVPVGAIATTFLLGLAAPTASELGGATLVIAGLAVGLTAGRPRTAADTPVAPASVAG